MQSARTVTMSSIFTEYSIFYIFNIYISLFEAQLKSIEWIENKTTYSIYNVDKNSAKNKNNNTLLNSFEVIMSKFFGTMI